MPTFQVGDRVRVVCKITEPDPVVWDNAWANGMSAFVGSGEVYVVNWVKHTGIHFAGYGWHPDSLELVERATTLPTEKEVEEILSQKIGSVEAAQQMHKDLVIPDPGITAENYPAIRDTLRVSHGYFTPILLPSGYDSVPQDLFLHVSKDRLFVSFAESDDKRRRDIWQKMKYGRYLTKYHPELGSEQVKKAVAAFDYDHGDAVEVHFGETEEDFINAIRNGPTESCMAREKLNYVGHVHPAAVYAAGDIKVAWVEDGERITARTLINKETKGFSRVYGDETKLKKLLEDAGYWQAE